MADLGFDRKVAEAVAKEFRLASLLWHFEVTNDLGDALAATALVGRRILTCLRRPSIKVLLLALSFTIAGHCDGVEARQRHVEEIRDATEEGSHGVATSSRLMSGPLLAREQLILRHWRVGAGLCCCYEGGAFMLA